MDGTLVERARAGDAGAFDQLVRARIDAVYRTALGILGQPSDARDATQDAFLAAWRKLPGLRDPDRFDAWLHRITVNSCRMILRRQRGVREIHLSRDADSLLAGRPITAAGETTAAAFDRAFERLTVDQRALILDHHLDGLSISEIADRLGIPEGTAKSRLHTARRVLERALEQDDR